METLETDERGSALWVRLNRPEVRNAINDTMAAELDEVCRQLEREPQILVITGVSTPERGIFASGADIGQLRERGRDEALAGINSTVFRRINRLPLPVIAAVDGPAIGGGAELAYAADLRIVTSRTVFGNPEAGLGIVAAAGALWRLRELVGEGIAKELLFTGGRIDASRALALGLVNQVVEPDALESATERLVEQIAQSDPLALRLTKRLLAAPAEAHPLLDELAQAILFESEAKEQRMSEFLARRSAHRAAKHSSTDAQASQNREVR